MNQICASLTFTEPRLLRPAIQKYSETTGVLDLPSVTAGVRQREWDEAACRVKLDALIDASNQLHKSRLLAASAANSGSWLHALPLPSFGLHLDDETVRISVALRL